jgi:hypothetical protein
VRTAVHIYKPAGVETTAEFEAKYGAKLWEVDDQLYDWDCLIEVIESVEEDEVDHLGTRHLQLRQHV